MRHMGEKGGPSCLEDVRLASEERPHRRDRAAQVSVNKLLDVGARLRGEIQLEASRGDPARRELQHRALSHRERPPVEDAQRGRLREHQRRAQRLVERGL